MDFFGDLDACVITDKTVNALRVGVSISVQEGYSATVSKTILAYAKQLRKRKKDNYARGSTRGQQGDLKDVD